MTKKIAIISFWADFNYEKNFIIDLFISPDKNYEYTLNLNEADLIIFGSFIKESDIKQINPKSKKILYISEPIEICYPFTYELFNSDFFDGVTGCIQENPQKNYIRWPFYCLIFYLDGYNESDIEKINDYVETVDLSDKKFCCLINSHDNGGTRLPIYNVLKVLDNIDCPGKLLNNCSNEELNKLGNREYIKNFLFNICPENFAVNLPGYTTEKIYNCLFSGAIPIYFGYLDDIDKEIINEKRILRIHPDKKDKLEKAFSKVNKLLNNRNLLKKFYAKKVFKKDAFETIKKLENNVKILIDKLLS